MLHAGLLRDSVLLCYASSCQMQRAPRGKLLKILRLVVRKNSIMQLQIRGSTRDASRLGLVWRVPNTIRRDDGMDEPFVGHRLRAADREHLDPVTCGGGGRCNADC